MKHLIHLFFPILLFCTVILPVCESEETEKNQNLRNEFSLDKEYYLNGEFSEDSKDYLLGKGDIVTILVRGNPEFSGNFEIGPDGKIQYPFIGDITAEGINKKELQEKITDLLGKYVKFSEVSISVLRYQSKFIYILGEVNKPGKYYISGDTITLRDAIIEAGLPTKDAATKRTYLIKTDPLKPNNKTINLHEILYKGKLKNNVLLMSGDLIVIPSTIHSKINNFLSKLLDPITRVAIIDNMVQNHSN